MIVINDYMVQNTRIIWITFFNFLWLEKSDVFM